MYAEALKNKTLELRKARDPMGSFLVAVQSAASNYAKQENPSDPVVTDAHALKAINSFIKSADDNLTLLVNSKESPTYIRAAAERALLKSFLPEEASDDAIINEVKGFLEGTEVTAANRNKMVGPIMAHLNTKFGAALNKKKASVLIQETLSAN